MTPNRHPYSEMSIIAYCTKASTHSHTAVTYSRPGFHNVCDVPDDLVLVSGRLSNLQPIECLARITISKGTLHGRSAGRPDAYTSNLVLACAFSEQRGQSALLQAHESLYDVRRLSRDLVLHLEIFDHVLEQLHRSAPDVSGGRYGDPGPLDFLLQPGNGEGQTTL